MRVKKIKEMIFGYFNPLNFEWLVFVPRNKVHKPGLVIGWLVGSFVRSFFCFEGISTLEDYHFSI